MPPKNSIASRYGLSHLPAETLPLSVLRPTVEGSGSGSQVLARRQAPNAAGSPPPRKSLEDLASAVPGLVAANNGFVNRHFMRQITNDLRQLSDSDMHHVIEICVEKFKANGGWVDGKLTDAAAMRIFESMEPRHAEILKGLSQRYRFRDIPKPMHSMEALPRELLDPIKSHVDSGGSDGAMNAIDFEAEFGGPLSDYAARQQVLLMARALKSPEFDRRVDGFLSIIRSLPLIATTSKASAGKAEQTAGAPDAGLPYDDDTQAWIGPRIKKSTEHGVTTMSRVPQDLLPADALVSVMDLLNYSGHRRRQLTKIEHAARSVPAWARVDLVAQMAVADPLFPPGTGDDELDFASDRALTKHTEFKRLSTKTFHAMANRLINDLPRDLSTLEDLVRVAQQPGQDRQALRDRLDAFILQVPLASPLRVTLGEWARTGSVSDEAGQRMKEVMQSEVASTRRQLALVIEAIGCNKGNLMRRVDMSERRAELTKLEAMYLEVNHDPRERAMFQARSLGALPAGQVMLDEVRPLATEFAEQRPLRLRSTTKGHPLSALMPLVAGQHADEVGSMAMTEIARMEPQSRVIGLLGHVEATRATSFAVRESHLRQVTNQVLELPTGESAGLDSPRDKLWSTLRRDVDKLLVEKFGLEYVSGEIVDGTGSEFSVDITDELDPNDREPWDDWRQKVHELQFELGVSTRPEN